MQQKNKYQKSNICPPHNNHNPQPYKYPVPSDEAMWVAVYIDQKFYLTSHSTLQKLQNLDTEINEQRRKLERLNLIHCNQTERKNQFNRQIQIKQSMQRRKSIQSAMSRQCKTEINQLKALKAQLQIQKQLVQEQMNLQNKTVEVRKRRQLKQSTTFVIRNPKQSRYQDNGQSERRSNKKNYMVAPHQLGASRKSREMSGVSEQKQKGSYYVQEKSNFKNSIKYKTIDYKSTKNQKQKGVQKQSQNQNDNTVKMSVHSHNRNNLNLNLNSKSNSKQKGFIITSRKQISSSSKQHKDSFVSGFKERVQQNKPDSKQQIQKLHIKLKKMQEKLAMVQKKQKQIQQQQNNKQKSNKTKEKQQKHKVLQQSKQPKKQHNLKQQTEKGLDQQRYINKADTDEIIDVKPQQFRPTLFNLREQKLKKLNITSSTVAYNYNQDLVKQKQQLQHVNDKQKMAEEINQLRKIVKQLKIQKIKQEAAIVQLQKQRQTKSNYSANKIQNSNKNNTSFQSNEFTFNQGLDNQSETSKQTTEKVKQQNLVQQKVIQNFSSSQSNQKPLIKKQPRRSLKFQSNNYIVKPVSRLSNKKLSEKSEDSATKFKKDKTKDLKSSQGMTKINNRNIADSNPQQINQKQKIQQKPKSNQLQIFQQKPVKNQQSQSKVVNKGKIIRQIFSRQKYNSSSFRRSDQISVDNYTSQNSRYHDTSIQHEIKLQQKQIPDEEDEEFIRPQVSIPQIEAIQSFPIPQLPPIPAQQAQQTQIISFAKKICQLFQIKVQGNQQLQFKRFKNCVVLRTKNEQNNKAIVWHFSGKLYVGGWLQKDQPGQDHKNGDGFQYVPNKHYYRGQFLDGKRNGFGTMILPNGNIYKGQWKNGEKHGKGVYFQKSINTYYDGQWKEGKKDGQGIIKSNQKQYYSGQFQKSIKNGFGTEIFANGDLYEGNYKNGKFEGKGRYFWSNGSIYVGNFVDGYRQGFGKWKSSLLDGDLYVGQYKKDKKQGKGKYTWYKGCIFDGNFVSDMKHGQGKVNYPDGRQVIGVWQYGKLKKINKNESQMQIFQQSQVSSLQIQPRIRPNIPRIYQTPSKKMQSSRLLQGI